MSSIVFEDLLERAEAGDPQSCLEIYSHLTDPALPGYGRETPNPPRHYLKIAAQAEILDAMAILGVLVLTEGDDDYSRIQAIEMLESAYQKGSDLVIDLIAVAEIEPDKIFAEDSPLRCAVSSSDQLVLDRILHGYLDGKYTTLQTFNWLRLFRSASELNTKLLIQTALKNPDALSYDLKRLVDDINKVIAVSDNNSGSPQIYASEKKLFSPYLIKKVINPKFPDRKSQQGKEQTFQYLSAMLKYFHDYFREIAVSQIRGELSQFNARWIASIPFEEDLDAYLTNRLSQKTKLALYKRPLNVIRHYGGWFHRISRQLKRLSTPYGDYRFELSDKFKDLPAALFVIALFGLLGTTGIYHQLLKDPDFNICETTYSEKNKLFSGGLWKCAFDYQHRNSLRRENIPSFQRILEGLQSRFSEGVNTVLADERFSELAEAQFDISEFASLTFSDGWEVFFTQGENAYKEYKQEQEREFLANRISQGTVECSHTFEYQENGLAFYQIDHDNGRPDFVSKSGVVLQKGIPPSTHCLWMTKPRNKSHYDEGRKMYGLYLPDPDGQEVITSTNENFRITHQLRDYLHSEAFPLSVVLARVSSDASRYQIVGYRFAFEAIQENIDARLKTIEEHIEPVNRMKWWTNSYWNNRDQKLKPVAFR